MLTKILTGVFALLTLGTAPAWAGDVCCPRKPAEPAKEPYEVNLHIVSDAPAVEIKLGCRNGSGVPCKQGCAHLGGGNIDVAQPSSDTVIITLGGAAVACGSPCCHGHAGYSFDVQQCFQIDYSGDKHLKLILEGELIGLLRSHCKGGTAQSSQACGSVSIGGPECTQEIVSVCMPPHSVCCGENLSINDRQGPVCVPVCAGCYTLHAVFGFSADQPKGLKLCKCPSAEFAEGALDPLWIDCKEPFYGAKKGKYGFTLSLRVIEVDCGDGAVEEGTGNAKPEPIDLPKKEEEKVLEKLKGVSLNRR